MRTHSLLSPASIAIRRCSGRGSNFEGAPSRSELGSLPPSLLATADEREYRSTGEAKGGDGPLVMLTHRSAGNDT